MKPHALTQLPTHPTPNPLFPGWTEEGDKSQCPPQLFDRSPLFRTSGEAHAPQTPKAPGKPGVSIPNPQPEQAQAQQLGMTPRNLMGDSVWETMSLDSTPSATSLADGGQPSHWMAFRIFLATVAQ